MTATAESLYQAKRIQLERVNANLHSGSTVYTKEFADSLVESMQEIFPDGSKVSVTSFKSVFDTEPVTIEGTVAYSVKVDDSEPCFEIESPDADPILLRGSLLSLRG